MAVVSLLPCKTIFHHEVSGINEAIREIKIYRMEVKPGFYCFLSNRTSELLLCLQFLRMHLCWEGFIESTLTRYLCGCSSPSGFNPILVSRKPRDLKDAMQIICGESRYVSWSPRETIDRFKKYLNGGEPFNSAISSALYQLNCIYSIRNRVAHRSEFAKERFRETVRNELGYNPRGMTPGRFLMMQKKIGKRRQITYFQYYIDILLLLSRQIVP